MSQADQSNVLLPSVGVDMGTRHEICSQARPNYFVICSQSLLNFSVGSSSRKRKLGSVSGVISLGITHIAFLSQKKEDWACSTLSSTSHPHGCVGKTAGRNGIRNRTLKRTELCPDFVTEEGRLIPSRFGHWEGDGIMMVSIHLGEWFYLHLFATI